MRQAVSWALVWAVMLDTWEREKPTPAQKHQLRKGRHEEPGTDLEVLDPPLHLLHLVVQLGGIAEAGKVLLLLFDEAVHQPVDVPILRQLQQVPVSHLPALEALPLAPLGPLGCLQG